MTLASTTPSSFVRQLSDQNSDGTAMGASPTDLIGFYTNSTTACVPQRSGAAQSPINSSDQVGQVTLWTFNATTASVTANSSAEVTTAVLAVLGATTNGMPVDSVLGYVPGTTQAGLAVGGVRVTSSGALGVNWLNASSVAIVPTSSCVPVIFEVKNAGGLTTTATLSPVSVAANTTVEQSFTVTGAQPGMQILVNKPTVQAGLGVVQARATAANTVAITFANVTGSAIVPTASESYGFALLPSIDLGASNLVNYIIPAALITAAVGASTTVETSTALVNMIAPGDSFIGASKPAVQSGIGLAGGRVTATGGLGISISNNTTTSITPTSTEVWQVAILRGNMKTPLRVGTATLNATSVPVSTSVEQTTTISSTAVSSAIFVTKPTVTPGIVVGGARMLSSTTLAVTYENVGTTTIAVPSETYTVSQGFQVAVGPLSTTAAGLAISIDPANGQNVALTNELRAAMTALGLIKGSA